MPLWTSRARLVELSQYLAELPHLIAVRGPVVGSLRGACLVVVVQRTSSERRCRRIAGGRGYDWCGCRISRGECCRWRTADQRRERGIQRLGHRDSPFVRNHDAFELGNTPALRAEIKRLHVYQRAFDRK